MKTEKEKMLSGELYNPLDQELTEERIKCRSLLKALNDSREADTGERIRLIKELIPDSGLNTWLQPPFYCDYGYNIQLGDSVFLNFNCIFLDVNGITVGSRTLIGPNVQIYAATHPITFRERAEGLEYGKPVKIGEDVWIGGNVVILPGVTVGDRSVIGAGSVVTKDIPPDVVVAGNPCITIRTLL